MDPHVYSRKQDVQRVIYDSEEPYKSFFSVYRGSCKLETAMPLGQISRSSERLSLIVSWEDRREGQHSFHFSSARLSSLLKTLGNGRYVPPRESRACEKDAIDSVIRCLRTVLRKDPEQASSHGMKAGSTEPSQGNKRETDRES